MIRVFLADDHPVMVRGLERLLALEDDLTVVGMVHDLGELEARAPDALDVLVLDVSMPGMNGGDTIASLRARHAPILLFTLEPETAQVVALLRAGASGVVSKSAPVSELIDAIRVVARGGRAVPMALEVRLRSGESWPHDALSERARHAPILLFTLEPETAQVVALLRAGASGVVSKSAPVSELIDAIRVVARGGRAVPMALEVRLRSGESWPHDALSEREQAIFQRLVRGGSPKTIAFELGLSPSTVYTYAERVREKLGVSGQVELVDYAHRAGLLGKGSVGR